MLFTVCLCGQLLAEPVNLDTFYGSLKDGLSVEDLQSLGSLSEDQKSLASFAIKHYNGAESARYIACCSNLKNSGTALEMWSTDNEGKYPQTLEPLTPSYLLVALSCPTTDSLVYQYELKDGVYYLQCPGDHSDSGVEVAPSYNGEVGLVANAPAENSWRLHSYRVEPRVDQYSTSDRVRETWRSGEDTRYARTQIESEESGIGRVCAINDDAIGLVWGPKILNLMDAYYRKNSLVDELTLMNEYRKLSPAAFGLLLHSYLTDQKWADSRERLKAALAE